MNINNHLSLPPSGWVRETIDAAKEDCAGGESCHQERATQDLVRFAADELRTGISDTVLDEIPGLDEALGEPGKVVHKGVTTHYKRSEGKTEILRASDDREVAYGQLDNKTGAFNYILMSHREGQGTRYDGTLAGDGAYYTNFGEGMRTTGIDSPKE